MPKLLGLLLPLLAGGLMACTGGPAPTPTPPPEPAPAQAGATLAATLPPAPSPTPPPRVDLTLTAERLDAARTGLADIRRDYGLDLCEVLRLGYLSSVDAVIDLWGLQTRGMDESLEFLLDIGFRPSWQAWVLAQYNAPAAYDETWELYDTIPDKWLIGGATPFDYKVQATAAQTSQVTWEILGNVCQWPPAYSWVHDLTPETLASARQARGGLADEDAISRLGELRRRHGIDICRDLETYRSGLLLLETKVTEGATQATLHVMLDFLLDLGYWPTWREWVLAQFSYRVPEMKLEELGLTLEEYLGDTLLVWERDLETKLTAAQTNEIIWDTLWGLCGLTPTPAQG